MPIALNSFYRFDFNILIIKINHIKTKETYAIVKTAGALPATCGNALLVRVYQLSRCALQLTKQRIIDIQLMMIKLPAHLSRFLLLDLIHIAAVSPSQISRSQPRTGK